VILEGLLGPGGPLAGSGGRTEYCGGLGYGHSLIEWLQPDPEVLAARLAAGLDRQRMDSLRRRWQMAQAIRYEQPENLLRDLVSLRSQQSSLADLVETLDRIETHDLLRRLEEHFRLDRAALITLRPRGAGRQAA